MFLNPDVRAPTRAYRGVNNFSFSEHFAYKLNRRSPKKLTQKVKPQLNTDCVTE